MRRTTVLLSLLSVLMLSLCLSCYDHCWGRWGWGFEVDNDRNDFYFRARDLWWEDWSCGWTWRCDTEVAEVIFNSEDDFEGEVSIRVYDDHDYLIFSEWYEGEGEIYDSSMTAPGDPGYWRIRIQLRDVDGSFRVRVLAQ